MDRPLADALEDLRRLGLEEIADCGRPPPRRRTRPEGVRPAAGPDDPRVLEARAAQPVHAHLRRRPVRAAAGRTRDDPPARAARPRVRRAAHARGRRQRPHQHPGQLRRLRDAAGGQPRRRPHHAGRPRTRWRDLRRARHRHHQARVPDGRRDARLPRLQAARRSGRPLQRRQAAARRGPAQRVYAELQPARPRIADHAAVGHRGDQRRDQGLPALRQVQAGLQHPRAGREPALFAAQQDPRHLDADRGVPVRGTDAPRHLDPALGRVRRRRRSLHGLPQMRNALPRRHRLR